MGSTSKRIREVHALARDLGLECELVSRNKHLKFRLVAPDGRTMLQTMSATTSSESGKNNADAFMKRFARGGNT